MAGLACASRRRGGTLVIQPRCRSGLSWVTLRTLSILNT
jgi:hypothetical protein